MTAVDRVATSSVEESVDRLVIADLDDGLPEEILNSDQKFETVVVADVFEHIRHPDQLLQQLHKVTSLDATLLTSFPNFGHWKVRLALLAGRMPVTASLPERWFDTPNIHLCTVRDFEALCAARHWRITDRALLNHAREGGFLSRLFPNLFAEVALFELRPAKASFAV